MVTSDSKGEIKQRTRNRRELKKEVFYIMVGVLLSFGVQSFYDGLRIANPSLNAPFFFATGLVFLSFAIMLIILYGWGEYVEADAQALFLRSREDG